MDQYLRSEYLDDKHDLGEVSDLIAEIGPVFVASFDRERRAWSYELQDNEPWKLEDKYSYSTNAMILFSLAAVTNRVRSSVLVPGGRPRKQPLTGEECETAIVSGWAHLKEMCGKSPGTLTESGTYGRDDPFTLTWLVELLACPTMADAAPADAALKEKIDSIAGKLVEEVFQSPSTPVLSRKQPQKDAPDHTFPLLRVIQLGTALEPDELKRPDRKNVRQHLIDRLHHQLSASAVQGSNFDPAELAFALEGILQIDRRALDAPLLERVFAVVTESQQRTPYWRPVKPFVSTSQGLALLPLSVEVASSLIRSCILLDGKEGGQEGYFDRHVGLFKQYANWLFSRVVRGRAKRRTTNASPSPAITFAGWHSEHVDLPDRIHLWQTSQVLNFLVIYERMLQKHIAFRALTEVGLSVNYAITRLKEKTKKDLEKDNKRQPNAPFFPSHYWSEVGLKKEPLTGLRVGSRLRVAREIERRFVAPRDPEGSTQNPAWSMLLYGPPGTGKTGFAEDLAAALEFPLVTITPSDFIRRGEAEVEARAKEIFDALGEQTDMVVLFDEIDRLILDRDSLDYREQGDIFQFMTPSMLPKLKDLRSREGVVFAVGTNFADRIDPAAKRAGRIDHQFLVAPPDLKQRAGILRFLLRREVRDARGKARDWWTVVKDLKEDDLAELASKSPLAVFSELVEWVRSVVVDLKGTPDKQRLIERLKSARAELPSGTVRLLSYSGRFRYAQVDGAPSNHEEKESDAAFPSAQEPFDEFLLLLYLRLEAGEPLTTEEKKLARRVVGRFLKSDEITYLKDVREPQTKWAKEALMNQVRDKTVVQKIVGKALQWLPD